MELSHLAVDFRTKPSADKEAGPARGRRPWQIEHWHRSS